MYLVHFMKRENQGRFIEGLVRLSKESDGFNFISRGNIKGLVQYSPS